MNYFSSDPFSPEMVNTSLDLIVEGIESCTKPLFSKPCGRSQKSECSVNDNNLPWFDDDCRTKRQEACHCLNLYRSDKTAEHRNR